MHICPDEIFALLASVPFLGVVVAKATALVRKSLGLNQRSGGTFSAITFSINGTHPPYEHLFARSERYILDVGDDDLE